MSIELLFYLFDCFDNIWCYETDLVLDDLTNQFVQLPIIYLGNLNVATMLQTIIICLIRKSNESRNVCDISGIIPYMYSNQRRKIAFYVVVHYFIFIKRIIFIVESDAIIKHGFLNDVLKMFIQKSTKYIHKIITTLPLTDQFPCCHWLKNSICGLRSNYYVLKWHFTHLPHSSSMSLFRNDNLLYSEWHSMEISQNYVSFNNFLSSKNRNIKRRKWSSALISLRF